MCVLLACRTTVPVPAGSHQHCIVCGVLRPPAWFSINRKLHTGRRARCRPCIELYSQQKGKRDQQKRQPEEVVAQKLCSVCMGALPAVFFSGSMGGSPPLCRHCRTLDAAVGLGESVTRSSNQASEVERGSERVCSQCHVEKPWAEFSKSSLSQFRVESRCTQCRSAEVELLRLSQRSSDGVLSV